MPVLPCRNKNCNSFGQAHPNCKCYMANGGMICSGPHHEKCDHYANGGMIEENEKFLNYPQLALDHAAINHGLHHILTGLGDNGRSDNSYKHIEDYMNGSKKGHKALKSNITNFFDKNDLDINHRDSDHLKDHLDALEANPEKALETGGSLGEVLPDHASALGIKTANTMNYFQGLKPRPTQKSPLDPKVPPSKNSEAIYRRQLHIAENPLSILNYVKKGSLQTQDLKTLHTVYPALAQDLTQKAATALIDSQTKNKKISYKEKQGLSVLLGQPLDSIQTPQSMQAIIQANSTAQSQQNQPQKQPKKATGVELKQIDKVNKIYPTDTQDRELDQRK